MRNLTALIFVSLANAGILEASLILDQNTADNRLTRTWTVNALENSPPTLTSDPVGDIISGSLSGGAALTGQSFGITFTAAQGWDSTASQTATTNGTLLTYLGGLTAANTNGANVLPNDGWGVNSGAGANRFDPGDAMIMTWDTSGLDITSQLALSEVDFNVFAETNRLDFVIYDVSANAAIFSDFNLNVNPTDNVSGNWILDDGDLVVIAGGSSSTGDGFRFDSLTVDIAAVPEPSSVILLSGLLLGGFAFARHRRKSLEES